MASLSEDKGKPRKGGGKRAKLYRVLFKSRDGGRQSVRLGEIPAKNAQGILVHIEALERAALDGGVIPGATAEWLNGIGDDLRAKLISKGLAAPKVEGAKTLTLGELVDVFKARPAWRSLKPGSQRNMNRAFDAAIRHFGAKHDATAITVAGAADFYAAIRLPAEQGGQFCYAISTANVMAAMLTTLYRYAIDDELLVRDPFRKLQHSTRRGNNANVPEALCLEVLDAMEGTEGRLLFGLARWGGLRMPSEPRELRWCDIDRERERFLITSPKTAHHEGHETRWCPIFPELVPLLQERYDDAQEGEVYVLPCLRHSHDQRATNMLNKALRHSRIDAWPRLWHSLRATRQTELTERFPSHEVAAWLGNSVKIADRHYLMTLDEHFARAAHRAAQYTPERQGISGDEPRPEVVNSR